MAGAYKRSKFLAEQVALEFARYGLSRGDRESDGARWAITISSRLRRARSCWIFSQCRCRLIIDTGLNVVDVRDTAEGHLLACEQGRAGRAVHSGLPRT